ncbi:MAG: ISSpo3, transposase [Caulobacteraceae bacterium]|nr:ISSpo3, transposase [Caulobacteraceae bacterium]
MRKSPKPPTVRQFMARFPDDAACLEHLMRTRWGDRHQCVKCEREAHYYRVKARRCYECEHCGHQVHPMAGTPFERTRTSLKDWFFVMFLFCASRNGVAAKEVERQIGVTYKTAWRMCHEIRAYMGYVDGDAPLGGEGPGSPVVEIDKAFIGGHDKRGEDDKHVVLGMVERGGEIIARAIPDRSSDFVHPPIKKFVKDGSRVATDEARPFKALGFYGYNHATVNHSAGERVRGEVHTNTIDSFWSMLKRGINGTYIHVSSKHLQKYLWEFEFRHNLRKSPHLMLDYLLLSFPRNDPTPWPQAGR